MVTPPAPYNISKKKKTYIGSIKNNKRKEKRFIEIISQVNQPSFLEWQHLALLGLPCTLRHWWTIPSGQVFQALRSLCWCLRFPQASTKNTTAIVIHMRSFVRIRRPNSTTLKKKKTCSCPKSQLSACKALNFVIWTKMIQSIHIRTLWKLSRHQRWAEETKTLNLREICALSPDATVMADNCGGGEALFVPEIAHQVIVDVCLPRHLLAPLLLFCLWLIRMFGRDSVETTSVLCVCVGVVVAFYANRRAWTTRVSMTIKLSCVEKRLLYFKFY